MNKQKIWVTSDLHFWHTNIIRFENRPWDTVEEMNQGLVDRWNAKVSDEDTVYILGDLCFAGFQKLEPILKKLKGHKILVRGNHDSRWLKNGLAKQYFDEIVSYKILMLDKTKKIVMSHFPIACWENMERGSIHLYGHIHSNSHTLPEGFNREQSFNVGVDTNHYEPIELDWIINIIKMRQEPEKYIPKDTCYCYDNNGKCPFWDSADNMGSQNYGICHYLGTSDFEQNKKSNHNDAGCWSHSDKCTAELFYEQFPHSLLWDECKECGINDDWDEEPEEDWDAVDFEYEAEWDKEEKERNNNMKPWKCDKCGTAIMVYEDYEPIMCCSGLANQCGCMGMPIDPMFCDACFEEIYGGKDE